jgi:Na+/H+ antiporter NhaD/arsenite permease-like protein
MHTPVDHRPAVLVIFILTYVGLAAGRIPGLKLNRTGFALLGAIAMMVFSGNTPDAIASMVSWPTILLLFGFFVISAQLRLSGFYDWVAAAIAGRLSAPTHFLAFLILVTAGLSAFLNHDVVCFVLAPVVATALLKRNMDPVPFLVALAAASNIGAAATLIGNAQDMLIGTVAGLGFARYMLWAIVPVAVGLLCTYAIARMAAHAGPPKISAEDVEPPGPAFVLDRYHTIKGLVVLGITFALFFTRIPREITVLVAASIHLLSSKFRTENLLALVDWQILLLFGSLFVVGGSFQATGYGEHLIHAMQGLGFDPARPLNEVLLTTGLSVLINNAPAVVLLVKIVPLGHVATAYVMALSNSFAGNMIMTASVANLIVVQQARKQGVVISFFDFFRLGAPIAVVSLGALVAWAAVTGP